MSETINKNSPTYLFAEISTKLNVITGLFDDIKKRLEEGQTEFAEIKARLTANENDIAELNQKIKVSLKDKESPTDEQIELALLKLAWKVILANWGKLTCIGTAVGGFFAYIKSIGHQ